MPNEKQQGKISKTVSMIPLIIFGIMMSSAFRDGTMTTKAETAV